MKRIKLLIIILLCLVIINVKADAGGPVIIAHEVVVTNKNGAQCYENVNGKKEDRVIKYGTTLKVYSDIEGKYIYVDGGNINCFVRYVDISSKTQNFNIDDDAVDKIDPIKAIILASGGLNLRKGPSVTYSTLLTIPQYTVVTLTRQAGTYWYYTEYNGKSGWITSINGYIAEETKNVLIDYEKVNIYDFDGKKVLGTIPANTEITDYVLLMSDSKYYIVYNGIKGYVDTSSMMYKVSSPGKIKLIKDYVIRDVDGNPTKKITSGQELEYTMIYSDSFYIPDRKQTVSPGPDEYVFVKEAKEAVKTRGYLGEGIFGETKTMESGSVTPEPSENSNENNEKNENKMSSRDIIIIGLLAGIFLSLTALVIIKLTNKKNKDQKVVIKKEIQNEEKKELKEKE